MLLIYDNFNKSSFSSIPKKYLWPPLFEDPIVLSIRNSIPAAPRPEIILNSHVTTKFESLYSLFGVKPSLLPIHALALWVSVVVSSTHVSELNDQLPRIAFHISSYKHNNSSFSTYSGLLQTNESMYKFSSSLLQDTCSQLPSSFITVQYKSLLVLLILLLCQFV